jgi:hypothetical protein
MKSLTAMRDGDSTAKMAASTAVRRASGHAARVRLWNFAASGGDATPFASVTPTAEAQVPRARS